MFDLNMTPLQLDAFLQKHRLSDEQFARILGITVPAIHHWRAGRRRIPDIYAKLIRTFDKYPGLLTEF